MGFISCFESSRCCAKEDLPTNQNTIVVEEKPCDDEDTLDQMYLEAQETKTDEFRVALNKSEDAELGIEVSYIDGETLKIDKINDAGLVKTWNDTAPEGKKIHVGDHFVEINGKRGKANDLLEEAGKKQHLHIKVWSRKLATARHESAPFAAA